MRPWAAGCLVLLVVLPTSTGSADDSAAHSGGELNVLGPDSGQLLHQYLLAEVTRQYDERRRDVVAALESSAAMSARRDRLRAQYRQMLGELPQRTPLNARTLGVIQRSGYRIERIAYESRPQHTVTANLYLPDGTSGPVPGVLVPCGHSANGKASDAYQRACILLALNGCAALIYDPIGQGERHQLPDDVQHGTTEHTLVGAGALLVGWNTANYRVWDGLRSLDYLAGRSEIDPQRLGCTGNSGGGTMTTWLMALDDRIVAAAPSCFITTVERLFQTIGPQDCEQHFPGQGAAGIEHADFITMRAPRPTLILAAERDFFDIAGTRTAFADAGNVYRVLGQPNHVSLFTYDDEHGFSRPRREAAVAWMRRWLADDNRKVVESNLAPLTDAELEVTASGQVRSEFPQERTVIDLAMHRAKLLAASRTATWNPDRPQQCVATIRRALALPDHAPAAAAIVRQGSLTRQGCTIEKLVLERPGRVPLPALLFVPEHTAPTDKKYPAVIFADGRGKARDAAAGGPIEQLARQGKIVLALDVCGCGETADAPQQGKYHNDELRTAMLALHIGRPLLSLRVEELLAARAALAADPRVDAARIDLVGVERLAPVALHAAAIEPGFRTVELHDSLRSWTDDVVARPLATNALSQVVPGVLVHYDLPDLARLLGARLHESTAK